MGNMTETEQRQMRDFAQIMGMDSYLSEAEDGCRMISTLAGVDGRALIARYDLKRDAIEDFAKKRTTRDKGTR